MTRVERMLFYTLFVPLMCIIHGLIGGFFVWLAFGQIYHLIPDIRPLTYWESTWLCVLLRSLIPNVAVTTVKDND